MPADIEADRRHQQAEHERHAPAPRLDLVFAARFESAAQWATGYGAHPRDLDNLQNTNRMNNALKFKRIDRAGFRFGAACSLGGTAGGLGTNQIWSLGAGYEQGPLSLGAGYLNVRRPNFSFFGNHRTSSPTASNLTASTVYADYASASTQQIIAAGGAYRIGKATVGAIYTNTQFRGLGSFSSLDSLHYPGTAAFHNVEANFRYLLTPALTLGIAYDYMKAYAECSLRRGRRLAGLQGAAEPCTAWRRVQDGPAPSSAPLSFRAAPAILGAAPRRDGRRSLPP
ncbi:porin [Burkholderia glumae]|nr:porin [Burkholderia glumae]